jgi:hypothetical protein
MNSERTKAFQQQLHGSISTLPDAAKHVLETSDASFMNTGEDAVREAKAAFQTLVVAAQDRLVTLSNESIVAFVMEAKIYKMIQTLKTCRTDLEAESIAICKTEDDYGAKLIIAISHLESARRQLSDKEADLDVRQILRICPFVLY